VIEVDLTFIQLLGLIVGWTVGKITGEFAVLVMRELARRNKE
jgi:hypothetical protein